MLEIVSVNDSNNDKTSHEVSKLDKCQNDCTGETNMSKKFCVLNETAVHKTAAKLQKCNVTNVLSVNDNNNDKTGHKVSELDNCQNDGAGESNMLKKSLYNQNRQGGNHLNLETEKYDLELRL